MKKSILLILVALIAFIYACNNQSTESTVQHEPATKEELGAMLFNDKILSQGNQVSCASCHIPAYAFSDTVALSKGVDGKLGSRNTPTAMNMSARNFFFHDGRAETLEEQAVGPIENPVEMNLPLTEAVKKLNADKNYLSYFKKLYNEKPTKENIADALATFERTLETSNTPFDRFMKDDESAISESAKRGQKIFNVKGKCFDCHFGPDFTTDLFRNIGLYNGKELNDVGRYAVTKNSADIGKFKTPGLRNIAVTGPYMHNGMFKTLTEVIDYYNEPQKFVKGSINIDTLMLTPLNLNQQEKEDLLAFLKTLTDDRFASVARKD
ncbi:MAG: cytochrome-c peroxidase [Bacteroidia bacterium]|nr:cytochrome-c peroxidase [Bacteroidia bacterium]